MRYATSQLPLTRRPASPASCEEAGANENPSENNDNAKENQATENEDGEESAGVGSGKRRRVLLKWTVIGEWDVNQYLAAEIMRNRGQYSVGRNPADGRIRPCRMAEHKGKTDQVHRSMVPVQGVRQRFGTNIS